MTYYHVDFASGNDSNGGTDWTTDALLTIGGAITAGAGATDIIYVRNNGGPAATASIAGPATYTTDPLRVFGVKSGTTATGASIAQSDLIPGYRTGQSTPAYTPANSPPTFTTTGSSSDLNISGYIYFYGVIIKSQDDLNIGSANYTSITFEECHIVAGNGEVGYHLCGNGAGFDNLYTYKNCKIEGGTNSGTIYTTGRTGRCVFEGCEIDIGGSSIIYAGGMDLEMTGCDLTASTIPLVSINGMNPDAGMFFRNNTINASSALTTGSIASKFRVEFYQTVNVSGKGTGDSIQNFDIVTDAGTITENTTVTRTGGADDGGDGAYSLAFTPNNNGTYENRYALVGPWLAFHIAGDGTSQTVSVYINNSTAGDYDDDEVWVEVYYPSEGGDAQHDWKTDQMDHLGTPSNTGRNDTGSSWSGSVTQAQTLSVDILPDFSGIAYIRVHFAKNTAGSETLYVDPLPVVT